jgi:hypothetical protein
MWEVNGEVANVCLLVIVKLLDLVLFSLAVAPNMGNLRSVLFCHTPGGT